MKLSLSRRRIAIVVGAIATTAAIFAPSAVADPPRIAVINCQQVPGGTGGSGIVTLSAHGVVKGHCSFTQVPELVAGNPRLIACDNPALIGLFNAFLGQQGKQLTSTPRGNVTVTPSGNVNVNCHDVAVGNIPS